MDTKIIFAAFIFLLSTLSLSAQDNFLVHHVNGKVYIFEAKQKSDLVRGMIVRKENKLELKINASCMLIEKSGKSVNLNKPGVYDFAKLSSMLKVAGKDNVADEFMAYVYDNFTKKKKQDRLGAAPVVLRGHPKMSMPSDSFIITSEAINFKWDRISKILSMELVVRKPGKDVIFDSTFKQPTSYSTTISKLELKNGKMYEWKADEAGSIQPSEKYFSFIVAKASDRKKIEKQKREIANRKIPATAKFALEKELFEYWLDKYDIDD